MELAGRMKMQIGNWSVDAAGCGISRGEEKVRLEVRTMRLLMCLADRAGEVVSIEELLKEVWGEVNVSPDSVYQAVASLRKQLGDDAKEPKYIETVPKLGYRLVAKVGPGRGVAAEKNERGRRSWLLAGAIVLFTAILGGFLFFGRAGVRSASGSAAVASPSMARPVAVLPFLDLTEGMKEEEFADGMTEELIDKLSKVPGLRVPTATSSFYFKGKQIGVADVAKSLAVTYVLDGSVRQSGGRVRIAARLVRADDGFVLWTETYDRPFRDVVMIQDEIAQEVSKALEKQWRVGSGGSR